MADIINTLSLGYNKKAIDAQNEYEKLFSEKKEIIRFLKKIDISKKALDNILLNIEYIIGDNISNNTMYIKDKYISFLNTSVSTVISEERLTKIIAGIATGSLSTIGAWQIISILGTASTGTAISSLSGAAATTATLSIFGGGSVASGGLGMLGGISTLAGIFAVATIPGVMTTSSYKKYKGYSKACNKLKEDLRILPTSKELKKINDKLIKERNLCTFLIKEYKKGSLSKEDFSKRIYEIF